MGNTNNNQNPAITIDSFAVTDMKVEVFNFRWDIKHFRERLQIEDPKYNLGSPLFFFFGENENCWLQWQVKVGWTDEKRDLSLFLFLTTAKNPIFAEFHFELLGDGQSSLRRFGSGTFIPRKQGFGFEKFFSLTTLLNPEYKWLEDDTLKLRFQIKIKKDTQLVVTRPRKGDTPKKFLPQKQDLICNLNDLFHSKNFADLSIQTKTSKVMAHKAILSCRSPVFSRMFQSNTNEIIDNTVTILEFDEEVVNGMLQYMYCGTISLECMNTNSQELFQIANKYDIKGLQEEAEEHIANNLAVINVVNALILADMNTAMELKTKAMKFINQNKAELKEIGAMQTILTYNPSLIEELYLLE